MKTRSTAAGSPSQSATVAVVLAVELPKVKHFSFSEQTVFWAIVTLNSETDMSTGLYYVR